MNDPTRVYVIPVPGHFVRDPMSREIVPPQGKWVPRVDAMGRWWRKRVSEGSLIVGDPPAKKEDVEVADLTQSEPEKKEKRRRTSYKEG